MNFIKEEMLEKNGDFYMWKDILKQYNVDMREGSNKAAKALVETMKESKPSNMVDGKYYQKVMTDKGESLYDVLTEKVEGFVMNSEAEHGFGRQGARGYLKEVDGLLDQLIGAIPRELIQKIFPAISAFSEASDSNFRILSKKDIIYTE
jgi:hypothetical protein